MQSVHYETVLTTRGSTPLSHSRGSLHCANWMTDSRLHRPRDCGRKVFVAVPVVSDPHFAIRRERCHRTGRRGASCACAQNKVQSYGPWCLHECICSNPQIQPTNGPSGTHSADSPSAFRTKPGIVAFQNGLTLASKTSSDGCSCKPQEQSACAAAEEKRRFLL